MPEVRAATVAGFTGVHFADFSSDVLKDPTCRKPTLVVKQVVAQCRSRVLWTHSPFDQHESHRFTFERVVAALLELPLKLRPGLLLGGEVWGALDWVDDRYKLSLDISDRSAHARRILQQYKSQIGAHHYDEGAEGRWKSNGAFRDPHEVQKSLATVYAIDLTPLIDEDPMSIDEFVSRVVSTSLGFEYPILHSRRTSALPVRMASRQASPPQKPLKTPRKMEIQR